MRGILFRARMALGGAIWGGLFGAAVGAIAGTVFGLAYQDISFGLDGALVGGALGILCGAMYGLAVSLEEPQGSADAAEMSIFTETIHLTAIASPSVDTSTAKEPSRPDSNPDRPAPRSVVPESQIFRR